jgi:hypothetical protein
MMKSGTAAPGNVTRTFTRVGRATWEISEVDWHTQPPPKPAGVSWGDYYAALKKDGWRVEE